MMNTNTRIESWFYRIEQYELPLCAFFNRANKWVSLRYFFKVISRLGDGVFWYCLIALTLLTSGQAAFFPALHILITAGSGVLLYKFLKERMVRERPFITYEVIDCNTRPLDRYSFPSGHTLHAVCFSIMLVSYYPNLYLVVVPFAFLVALSRFILGLHYISDVVVGALIGASLATVSLQISVLLTV